MNWFSLEKINKAVLFCALALLLFRNGSFSASYIPKPFEIVFSLSVIIFTIDVLKNKKIREVLSIFPKRIWMAVIGLAGSTLVGWGIALFVKGMPFYSNMLIEFGSLCIALGLFVLISFYIRNDVLYAKRYVHALLVPIVYILVVIFPSIGTNLGLITNNTFNGFTDNVNIVAKALLIPALFFITSALFESKVKRIVSIGIAAGTVTLLFLTAERGAFLSLLLGSLFVWSIVVFNQFTWKKFFKITMIMISIFVLGFLITPHMGKKIILNRVLRLEGDQLSRGALLEKSLVDIVTHDDPIPLPPGEAKSHHNTEPRFQIWDHYVREGIRHPLGLGPNTHMDAQVPYSNRIFINPGPHNTYLQVWLWGGIIGLLSFIYLIHAAFQVQIKSIGKYATALLGILITTSISIFFNDSLSFYGFWAILAISLQSWNKN